MAPGRRPLCPAAVCLLGSLLLLLLLAGQSPPPQPPSALHVVAGRPVVATLSLPSAVGPAAPAARPASPAGPPAAAVLPAGRPGAGGGGPARSTAPPLGLLAAGGLLPLLLAAAWLFRRPPSPLTPLQPPPPPSPTRWAMATTMPLTRTDRPLAPSEAMIDGALQQLCTEHYVDLPEVVRRCPTPDALAVDRVAEVVRLLASVGADVRAVLEAQPGLLTTRVSLMQRVVAGLREEGLDVAQVVDSYPNVLRLSPSRVFAVIGFLREAGLDPGIVVQRCPAVLRCSVDTMEGHAAQLRRWGLDVGYCVERDPAVLWRKTVLRIAQKGTWDLRDYNDGSGGHVEPRPAPLRQSEQDVYEQHEMPTPQRVVVANVTQEPTQELGRPEAAADLLLLLRSLNPAFPSPGGPEDVAAVAARLRGLGLDPIRVLHKEPALLRQRDPSTPQQVVELLAELGLDAVRVVEACPRLLTFSVKKLRPMLEFLLQLGYTAEDIALCPGCLNSSLEGRGKPRQRYLRHLGRLQPPLHQFLITTDKDFATYVAWTSLEDYRRWLATSGGGGGGVDTGDAS